jgi:hypothetical protein
MLNDIKRPVANWVFTLVTVSFECKSQDYKRRRLMYASTYFFGGGNSCTEPSVKYSVELSHVDDIPVLYPQFVVEYSIELSHVVDIFYFTDLNSET